MSRLHEESSISFTFFEKRQFDITREGDLLQTEVVSDLLVIRNTVKLWFKCLRIGSIQEPNKCALLQFQVYIIKHQDTRFLQCRTPGSFKWDFFEPDAVQS